MLTNIANEQIKLDHDISIIIINDIINENLRRSLNPRVRFVCLERKVGSKSVAPVIKLNLLLYRLKPDIIHLHYASIAKYLFFPSVQRRICVTMHDVCSKNNSRYLYKSRRIYAISNVVKKDILEFKGLYSEVVLNGIKPELINHVSKERDGHFRIVQVGRLAHLKKGQHILIQAVAQLVKQGYDNLELSLIGDGDSREYLENLVKDLGIKNHVLFLGAREQLYIFAHLHDYDLFVQPSIFEGFGLTVTEAMAAKVPVLVSENQGPLEIIDNGNYGYYFKNQDVDDCADKIELFINHKNDVEQIEKAYQRVTELYNVKTTAINYLNKYREFIDSGYVKLR
ncbi:glycosyltransferase [Marseilla massiliensis]|uniref:Glycosyltransferase n=2 Tax=Marseilla massiliensis TaxID=1841864 RepID=A0A938WP37_9BACT|nr:glycosyltransferase [Marseilla massiliensis]